MKWPFKKKSKEKMPTITIPSQSTSITTIASSIPASQWQAIQQQSISAQQYQLQVQQNMPNYHQAQIQAQTQHIPGQYTGALTGIGSGSAIAASMTNWNSASWGSQQQSMTLLSIYQDKKQLENHLEKLNLFGRAEFFINLKYSIINLGYRPEEEWNKWNEILTKKKYDKEFHNDLKDLLDL